MRSRSADTLGPAVRAVEAWRDADPRVRSLPSMRLGLLELDADRPAAANAERLVAAGARLVRLPEPVELCGGGGPALLLLRELTTLGLAVDWTACCADGCVADGELFHLVPPRRVAGADPAHWRGWPEQYLPTMCVFRRGPGFVEVRDRRFGALELTVIDEPAFLTAIEALLDGAPPDAVPAQVRGELAGARLIRADGPLLWWLPARLHRWPVGSFAL